MKKPAIPTKLLEKRIPTIFGLFVLVIALVAGIFFLGEGPGVFAPRATPSTTPNRIKVTNVTDNSFTISFLTDEETPGFVKYGSQANDLNSQASDDRDQLTGIVSDFQMHHITVRGLQPTTTYFYTLGTGSNNRFDNNGEPFMIKTAARNGAPAAAKTIYGSVSNQAGNPADGAVVYVTLGNAGEMSSLVKASGSWAVPLSNARSVDGNSYAEVMDEDTIIINVQGSLPSELISYSTLVLDAQPVPTLTFGQTTPPENITVATTPTPTPEEVVVPLAVEEEAPMIEASTEAELSDLYNDEFANSAPTSRSAVLEEITEPLISTQSATTEAVTKVVLDLDDPNKQTLTTSQPKLTGKVSPGVTVTIEVHSDTNIQEFVVADENGNFTLDIAALSKTLEPGEHEATYSYTDPDTNEVITKTVSFFVQEPVEQIAQAQPYGSGNPYPPETVAPATQSAIATQSAEATEESRVSMPSTEEGVPVSGSVGTTLALILGGLFFIISGLWSFWISHQLGKNEIEF